MRRLVFVSTFFVILFLPLAVWADGKAKKQRKAPVNCNKLKGKAKKACLARQAAAAAAAERRRREAARRAELAAQAQENRFRAETAKNIAKDVTKGEDLRIRQAAVSALGGKGGTIVVMEADTGKIVTMVNQEWAIKNTFKPCSTIKLVTGIMGLKENVINEDGGITDAKFSLDLDKATAKSNNPYFEKVGVLAGDEKFVSTAQTLGLGQTTGINAAGEARGRLPLVKKTGSSRPRLYSFGDETTVTALQLAVLAAEITTGRKPVPTIVKDSQTTLPAPAAVDIPKEVLEEIIPGMQDAAENGTGRRSNGAKYSIAGKTGTCSDEISRIGLFTSATTAGKPRYAVSVIIRGRRDQTNGPYAAAIAGKVYEALRGENPTTVATSEKLSEKPDIMQK